MTGTGFRCRQRCTHCNSALSAARFLSGAIIAAVLTIIASFLPSVRAAQATDVLLTRLELAAATNGKVSHRWSDDNGVSWSSEDLGAPFGRVLFGTPAVVSDGVGRIHFLALGDVGLWQNTNINGVWSAWTLVPGQKSDGRICDNGGLGCWYVSSYPAVASWGPGRMDLLLYGHGASDSVPTQVLLHSWADNYSWSGIWEVLTIGGTFRGSPGAVSWGAGRLDVFVIVDSAGGALGHLWFDNGKWYPNGPLENLGGVLTSSPAVASPGSGRLNIFTRGTDGRLWGLWFAGGGWGGWGALDCCLDGGGEVNNSVAAASLAPLTLDVFVIGANPAGALWRRPYNYYSGGWQAWQVLDWSPFTNIAATAWTPVPTPSGGLGGGAGAPACGPATGRPCPVPP
jgi:hypothetical protein